MIRIFLLGLLSAACVSAQSSVKIVLVGDSTVTDNAGWGLGFKQFLADGVTLTNTSRGGRSSMGFITEGSWEKALALKGDYYLIQFGHNDEPGKPGRSTTPEEFRQYMNQYVEDARAAKATPVLVTPLVRRQFRDKDNTNKIVSSLDGHAAMVREIAKEKKVPLVELHDRSKALCEKVGRDGSLVFSPKKEDGKYDGTHLNEKGYVLFGRIVAEELRQAVPALAPLILAEPRNANPIAGEKAYDAVVAFDGSGTHTTVQAAVNAVPDRNTKPFRILIKPGKYEGPILVPRDKSHVRFIGEEAESTILTYARNVKEPEPGAGQKHAGTGVIIEADDFMADRITFENTSGDHGQALALRVDGDRAIFTRCHLLGWQDTLMTNKGRQYFKDCHIEGRVDFIYGDATAVFDRCTIHSKNGGYVTAASTPADQPFGFVFFDCKLTGDTVPWKSPDAAVVSKPSKKPNTYLGRPWRPHASVTFVGCDLGDHIRPEGWHNWGKTENETTARYSEIQCTGPGAGTAKRVPWAKSKGGPELTIKSVLAGKDSWDPTTVESR